MKLSRILWDQYSIFLYTDRKLSEKKSAMSSDRSRFNKLADYFEDKDFTRDNFNIFIGQLKTKGLSNATLNNMIKCAKLLGRFMHDEQFKDYTYFREIPPVDTPTVSPEEITKLAEIEIDYSHRKDWYNFRNKTLIYLLGTTGARIGEVLDLTKQNVFDNPYRVIFRDTKSHEDRVVPIARFVYDLILALPSGKTIFHSREDGKLGVQEINNDLKRRAKELGIKKSISTKTFRHSYVTEMVELGADWLTFSRIVGHRDPKTTLRYLHNSLGERVNITQIHPLIQEEVTLENMKERLKKFIGKSVNTNRFKVIIDDDPNYIKINISKN